MPTIAERLADSYPEEQRPFIFRTTKAQAMERLDRLKQRVHEMEDFDAFPEGDVGVIVYALLRELVDQCPDVGDFGHELHGLQLVATKAFDLLADDKRAEE